jgi:hypothetical protein
MWLGDKYCNYKPMVFYDSVLQGKVTDDDPEGTAPTPDQFGAVTVQVDDPDGDSVRKETIAEPGVEITVNKTFGTGGSITYTKTVNGITTSATAEDFQYAKEHADDGYDDGDAEQKYAHVGTYEVGYGDLRIELCVLSKR